MKIERALLKFLPFGEHGFLKIYIGARVGLSAYPNNFILVPRRLNAELGPFSDTAVFAENLPKLYNGDCVKRVVLVHIHSQGIHPNNMLLGILVGIGLGLLYLAFFH